MKNPLKRDPALYSYELERQRLLIWLNKADPSSDEYETVMKRLNEIDRIHKRASEIKKALIPALGTVGGVVGIYALQQFAGVIVPRALEAIASRNDQKKHKESE